MTGSNKVIYVALAGNVAVAVTKLVAAAFTGSSAMLSEGIHSLVDTADEGLLLVGKRQSARPPDEEHPFGHGQELYFWALIVSLLIFSAGGAVSAYEGVLRVLHPSPSESSSWNYVVIGLAALFEGTSLVVGFRQFRHTYPDQPVFAAVRRSKDPTLFTVVFEDSAALIGLAIAFTGIFLSAKLGNPVYDASASILIGIVLMVVACFLVRECKGLLTGEAGDPEMQRSIRDILSSDKDVTRANPPLTMYFGPETVLLAAEIQFREGLTASGVAGAVDRIESAVRQKWPKVKRIFIEARSIRTDRVVRGDTCS